MGGSLVEAKMVCRSARTRQSNDRSSEAGDQGVDRSTQVVVFRAEEQLELHFDILVRHAPTGEDTYR